jgi:TetR/AcrR family transcriptional regulator, fatty acid metabolism regulator protein
LLTLATLTDEGKTMKNTRDTQREKFEAREASIIAAASTVFASRGVDGAKMVDIARQAGLAEGTLYLYYRNKHDLLTAVVGNFWATLTAGAHDAVDPHGSTFTQLEQLARYHLDALLAQFELVQLTYRARGKESEPTQDLEPIRGYVRIFDRVVERGIDRGELRDDVTLWQARDVFYGTLEFSARTLTLRGKARDEGVVDNLMVLLTRHLGRQIDSAQNDNQTATSNRTLMSKLSAIEAQLKKLNSEN